MTEPLPLPARGTQRTDRFMQKAHLAMGDTREALILLGFVFIIMGITALQERRTDKVLDALRDLSSPGALVLRGG